MKTGTLVAMMGAGLFLLGCGGTMEDAPAEDTLGTGDAALSGLTVSHSCYQTFNDMVCTATVSGGVPPYSYAWTEQRYVPAINRTYTSGFGSGATASSLCPEPDGTGTVVYTLRARVRVTDATGASVTTAYGDTFICS